MILSLLFEFFANYLIEFMSFLLVTGLIFRWAAYRSSRGEDAYFATFTREMEKILQKDKEQKEDMNDVETYFNHLLDRVSEKLPSRTLRIKRKLTKEDEEEDDDAPPRISKDLQDKQIVSLREYMGEKKNLFHAFRMEASAFKSSFPPNFSEITARILEEDDRWNRLFHLLPIGPINRLIDILPGIFVVFGIFGTFIGISLALPEIARIDFNNLEASGEILMKFVLNITYAMKTSIAGILFSLIMTFLNTAAPINGLREVTFRRIVNSLENLWYTIHSGKSTEEQFKKSIPKLVQFLERMDKGKKVS